MANRSALTKLRDAKELRRLARDMTLSNPSAAADLRTIASKKEDSAVRQYRTRPRKRKKK